MLKQKENPAGFDGDTGHGNSMPQSNTLPLGSQSILPAPGRHKPTAPSRQPQADLNPENIALYRSVFNGRADVVPEFWKSKRADGRTGYSPLCKNKWNEELCNIKKKIRDGCSTCENIDHTPLDDKLIEQHIRGNHILGIYPLLQDNTCHFIAADFDKHKPTDPDPFDEVKKYVDACEIQEIPCYILRSKSGNGYHVYIFFSSAVPAWKARVFSFALLGEAGVIGEDVELSTFDRLFPNQDQLSGKNLGNLISLPFQGKAGSKEHTLILDPATDYTLPYPDQWETLRNLEKVSELDLDALIKDWDLKKEIPIRAQSDFKPIQENQQLAVFRRIKNSCKFIKHCCDDADKLPEPEWYAFLSIIVRCKDGRRLAHKYSEDHVAYNHGDTEAKLEQALTATGPYTCNTIKTQMNSKYCQACPSRRKVSSPILLGHLAINDDTYVNIAKEINEKHAVIMVGGKCLIINEIIEPIFNRPDFTLSSTGDFRNFYANKKIADPENPDKEISIANVWLGSKDRREYPGGIIFDPAALPNGDHYNLWKGLAMEPRVGDWSLYRNHIFEVIAGGKQSIYDWVVAWLARIVQSPGGNRPGTAIVLRGKQGTGKGIFVNYFGRLLGKHFIQIAQSSQVTGRFNHHLKDVVLAFIDEGFWAGDKQAEGAMKNMITEPFITVEQKGKDIIRVKNHVNLILASNNDWVIPAGLEERRFFVLDIPDTRQQDHKYFKAIVDQMDNGGVEAMLHDLMELDISGVDLRKFEQTQGLFEQKLHSMTTIQKYWHERLVDGNLRPIPSDELARYGDYNNIGGWSGEVYTSDQYNDYLAFSERLHDRYPLCEQQFGLALQKMCKDSKKARQRKNGCRVHIRIFPDLGECRAEFNKLVKMEIEWEDREGLL
jgi:hypothetical protein